MIHEDDQEEEMQPLVSEVQRVSERIDTMMIEIAREREALNWSEMLLLLDDVVNHPRDIALAVKLARVVGTIESIFQLHQQLMNTMTESTGILLRLLQDAMSGEHAEPFLPRIDFLDGIRRVAENIDRMLAEVAHRQEAFHWEQLLLIVGELKHNPQDIERAMQLARAAPGLQGIFQLHQNVFTTAAESHALLRTLVSDEEKPSAPQQAPILPVSPHSTSSRMSSRLSIQTGRQTSSAQRVYRPSLAVRLLEGWVYGFLFAMMGFLVVVLLLVPMRGLSQVQQLATRGGFALVFLILAGVMAMIALWRTQASLVVTPQGIGYSTFGFRIFTPWENVEGSGTRAEVRSSGRGMSHTHLVSGLRLRQAAPVFQVRPWVSFMLAEIRDDPSRFIPISDVVADWTRSELADEIWLYAPVAMRELRDV